MRLELILLGESSWSDSSSAPTLQLRIYTDEGGLTLRLTTSLFTKSLLPSFNNVLYLINKEIKAFYYGTYFSFPINQKSQTVTSSMKFLNPNAYFKTFLLIIRYIKCFWLTCILAWSGILCKEWNL